MHSNSSKHLLLVIVMILISLKSYSQADMLVAQVRTQVFGRQIIDLSQVFRSQINAHDIERVVIVGTSHSYSTRLELAIDQVPTGIATIMQGSERDTLQPPSFGAWGRLQLIVQGQAMIDRIKIKLKPIIHQPPSVGAGRPDIIHIPMRARTRAHSDLVRIVQLLPYSTFGARLMRVEVKATSIDRLNSIQLLINNQVVDRQLSADPRGLMVLRFDTGMFKGATIGDQIRSISLATRGMIDIEQVSLRIVQAPVHIPY